ncbi:UNVERIFIED_CONTAM: hypothetical protein GTU68_012452 [Idotea baltica]|nr:hypothetical protein [Idotea baltica]
MTLGASLLILGIALFVLITAAAYTVYAERKLAAFIQQRPGPNRVGPAGLLQPLADVLKLLLKEDIVPAQGDKLIHFISPIVSVVIALVTFAVIPLGHNGTRAIMVADVNIGVLYMLGLTSISVYGVTLAGWASNSKYALLGGLRAAAQMVSYELALGLCVVSVIVLSNLRITPAIVDSQATWWNMFANPIGFLIFVTCVFAEANRTPFDLVEAEQELVGGFHTEYSSMKFATFFVAEYLHVIVGSMFIVTLFIWGWQGAWSIGWFCAKTFLWVMVFIWVRWTLPRFKYDQLMDIGWKKFLPLSILNLLVVSVVALIMYNQGWLGMGQ